ncbi:MAG: reverse transcriptase domain-containing protein [Thermoguttaceae bacterium]
MKRVGNLVERIADADNLRLAVWKAAKGKRAKSEVVRFRADLDARLRCLRQELLSGHVAWGPYRTFMVYDPKERLISAAPFRDRVAHHAIMNIVAPHFESYQIDESYACRPGKGLDAALARTLDFSRAGDWYLKLDVRKYFDSIDHDVLKMSLHRRFKDATLVELLEGIIDSHGSSLGRGLPIGNLTSQFFANHYLAMLDHRVKETLRCRRYVRYMDDFVAWDSEKDRLRRVRDDVAGFLHGSLRLELKPPCLNRCSRVCLRIGQPDRNQGADNHRKPAFSGSFPISSVKMLPTTA